MKTYEKNLFCVLPLRVEITTVTRCSTEKSFGRMVIHNFFYGRILIRACEPATMLRRDWLEVLSTGKNNNERKYRYTSRISMTMYCTGYRYRSDRSYRLPCGGASKNLATLRRQVHAGRWCSSWLDCTRDADRVRDRGGMDLCDYSCCSWAKELRSYCCSKSTMDTVRPKNSPLIPFSGMYLKIFIYHRNRTNSLEIADMYALICFFCSYSWLKTGLSTIRQILYTYLFSIFFTMAFIYHACCVSVQTQKCCMFFWYISCCVYQSTQPWLQRSKHSCFYHIPRTKQLSDNRGKPIKAENTKEPSNNRGQPNVVG